MKEKIKRLNDFLDKLDDTKTKKIGLYSSFLFLPFGFEAAALYFGREFVRALTAGDGAFRNYMENVRKEEEMARNYYLFRSRF